MHVGQGKRLNNYNSKIKIWDYGHRQQCRVIWPVEAKPLKNLHNGISYLKYFIIRLTLNKLILLMYQTECQLPGYSEKP